MFNKVKSWLLDSLNDRVSGLESLTDQLTARALESESRIRQLERENRQLKTDLLNVKSVAGFDWPVRNDQGFVCILARVHGRDIVQIYRIKPDLGMTEYKELSNYIRNRFAVGDVFHDVPTVLQSDMFNS